MIILVPFNGQVKGLVISLHQVIPAQVKSKWSFCNSRRPVYRPFKKIQPQVNARIDPGILQHFKTIFLQCIDEPSVEPRPWRIDEMGQYKSAVYKKVSSLFLTCIIPGSRKQIIIWIGCWDSKQGSTISKNARQGSCLFINNVERKISSFWNSMRIKNNQWFCRNRILNNCGFYMENLFQ